MSDTMDYSFQWEFILSENPKTFIQKFQDILVKTLPANSTKDTWFSFFFFLFLFSSLLNLSRELSLFYFFLLQTFKFGHTKRRNECVKMTKYIYYVYTNLGYKGMTLTNSCSYFVCFCFSLIHTHFRVLQRNRINGHNGGSTYLSIYFVILRNWWIWLWKNIKICNWQAEDPGETMVRFQRKARKDLYFSWRTGKWMS